MAAVAPEFGTPRMKVFVLAALCTSALLAHTAWGGNAPHSADAGRWELLVARPISGKYEDISFPDSVHGWITTARGEILHTADGGRTWAVQAERRGVMRSVDFLDSVKGFAGTLSGKLFSTEDGGRNWTEITSALPVKPQGFCGITHIANGIHMVGRYSGGVTDYFRSPDRGATWEHRSLSGLAQGLVDVAFVNERVGFIGGMGKSTEPNQGSATILKTDDGGRTWRTVYTHDGGRGFAWKLWVVSPRVVFAALQSQDGVYRVARSVNGGDGWETIIVAKGQRVGIGVQAIGFVGPERGWVGGYFKGMYETKDSGRTWRHVDLQDASINRFETVGGGLVTAGSRGILRFLP